MVAPTNGTGGRIPPGDSGPDSAPSPDDVVQVIAGVSREIGEGIGHHIAAAHREQSAALVDAIRSLLLRDSQSLAEIGRMFAEAHNAQLERVSIPVTAHIRQEAQPAPVVDTAPIVEGLAANAQALGDGLRALVERAQPTTIVQSPVTVDTGPLAAAYAAREDTAASAASEIAGALAAHAHAVSESAKATAALAAALGRTKRLTIGVERDATGAVKRYTIEES